MIAFLLTQIAKLKKAIATVTNNVTTLSDHIPTVVDCGTVTANGHKYVNTPTGYTGANSFVVTSYVLDSSGNKINYDAMEVFLYSGGGMDVYPHQATDVRVFVVLQKE